MSTVLVDNFQINASRPIDSRFVVGPGQFYATRADITYKYSGLRVYDLNDSTFYYWNGTIWTAETFGGGGGSGDVTAGGSGIFSYLPRFTGGNTITISQVFDNTFNVGFGTTVFGTEKYKFFGGDLKIEGGQLRVDDGNSSAPTYTFESDTSTGIYYDAVNTSVSFTVGASDIQHISSGGVSIETGVLKLTDGLNSAPSYAFNNYINSGMYYDTSKNSVSFAVNSTEQMHIINGVILIGSQTPASERLSLQSNSNTDATNALRIYANNLTQDAQYSWGGINSSYYFKINSGSGQSILLNTGFEVTNSGNALIPNGSVGSPGLAFQSDVLTGIYAPFAGQLAVSAYGAQKMRFASNDIFANIHNGGLNGIGDSGNNANPYLFPSIASGQFSASVFTGLVNCTGLSIGNFAWIRVGNVVNVTGRTTFTVTSANTLTEFKVGLPIKSVFGTDLGGGNANNWQLNGVGKVKTHLSTGNGTGGDVASIEAVTTTGTSYAYFKFRPSVAGLSYMTFSFQYILGVYPDTPPAPSPPFGP